MEPAVRLPGVDAGEAKALVTTQELGHGCPRWRRAGASDSGDSPGVSDCPGAHPPVVCPALEEFVLEERRELGAACQAEVIGFRRE